MIFGSPARDHTRSDLRCYLTWCAGRGLDPLAARRPYLELYIRWMQEIRRFKPSTVSALLRRGRVLPDLRHRRCAGALARRARPPPVSPGRITHPRLTHLQFEALLTAARQSPHPCDFALVAMLGLLGLRIFEATRTDITDLGEEHGHRVLRVCGIRHQGRPGPSAASGGAGPSTARSAAAPAGRSCSTAAACGWTATPPPAACGSSPKPPECGSPGPHPHMLRHTFVICSRQPEARGNPGLAASCLTNIRHSGSHVRQRHDQGLFSSLRSFPSRASLAEMALCLALSKIQYR